MPKYYDIDTPVRINGGLTVNGDTSIPSSYNLYVGGNITGNSNLYVVGTITGNIIDGSTANITNINSTGTISGGTVKGNGANLTVNGTTANGGINPISNGWAYTHENKIGSLGHIPSGGTASTFLRGDNTWVTPTDTNNYDTGISSTSGGNGTLTISRNGLTNLTLDLTHAHDNLYYGKSYVDNQLATKDYYGKWNLIVGGTTQGITASANVTITGNGATSVSMSGNLVTISSTDTNTWRPIDTSPVSGDTANSIASSWAYTHQNTTGIGSHIPTGGTISTYLRGDGTWQSVSTTDTYVTSISGNGNGTFYLNQNNGQPQLTLDLSHTHSQYVLNNSNNQAVNTGFTVNGTGYIGANNGSGALYVRTGSGSLGIQLSGDGSAQQSGVGIYLNANGTANFSGTMTANTIAVTSTNLVNNLNAQMVGGVQQAQLAKNQSIADLTGKGVYAGLSVSSQQVPNMTVQISSGTVYTNSGMRIVNSGQSISFATPSTTYNRIDSVYVQGSSAGANEGTIAVAQGTPSASPVAPSIPNDGVLLSNVTIRQNAGSILSTDISDNRYWINASFANDGIYLSKLYTYNLNAFTGNILNVNSVLKNSISNNSVTIPQGTTSYTWTHNLNLSQYIVKLSCNSPEPHIYWSNKTVNAITINLDDVCVSDVIVDIGIETF